MTPGDAPRPPVVELIRIEPDGSPARARARGLPLGVL